MRNTSHMNSTIAALMGSLIGTLGSVAIGVFQARTNRDVARDTAIRESARQFRPSRESGYRDLITAAIKARDCGDRIDWNERGEESDFDDEARMVLNTLRFAADQIELCRAVETEAQKCVLLGPASVTRAMNELSVANSKLMGAVEAIYYLVGVVDTLPGESMTDAASSAREDMSEALTVFMEQAQRALDEGEPRRLLRGRRHR